MSNKKIDIIESKTNNVTIQMPLSPTSPISPSSPTAPLSLPNAINQIAQEYKRNEEILATMKQIGFDHTTAFKLVDTLQGMIWKANKINKSGNVESSVIKITNKFLYQHSTAIINDKLYRVSEDILSEKEILKYLTQDKKCPNTIVKYKGFFHTDHDYWLIMEDGGSSLFDFVAKVRKLIKSNVINLSEWEKMVIVIFQQMLECTSYIHSKNVAFFDISLENWLINDVKIALESDANDSKKVRQIRFNLNDVQIRLCDFGLAQKFTKYNFVSNKWCGKKNYKSPEVYDKQSTFDARQNDVWCLGICLFVLLTGGIPWKMAHESDNGFAFVKKHSIGRLLEYWNIQYVDKHLIFILDSIFQSENERISLADVRKYFVKYVSIV